MFFSIEKDVFGRKLSSEERKTIKRDIWKIRLAYLRKGKVGTVIYLTKKRILSAFYDSVNTESLTDRNTTFEDWKEFISIFDKNGVRFLEANTWL